MIPLVAMILPGQFLMALIVAGLIGLIIGMAVSAKYFPRKEKPKDVDPRYWD